MTSSNLNVKVESQIISVTKEYLDSNNEVQTAKIKLFVDKKYKKFHLESYQEINSGFEFLENSNQNLNKWKATAELLMLAIDLGESLVSETEEEKQENVDVSDKDLPEEYTFETEDEE